MQIAQTTVCMALLNELRAKMGNKEREMHFLNLAKMYLHCCSKHKTNPEYFILLLLLFRIFYFCKK